MLDVALFIVSQEGLVNLNLVRGIVEQIDIDGTNLRRMNGQRRMRIMFPLTCHEQTQLLRYCLKNKLIISFKIVLYVSSHLMWRLTWDTLHQASKPVCLDNLRLTHVCRASKKREGEGSVRAALLPMSVKYAVKYCAALRGITFTGQES